MIERYRRQRMMEGTLMERLRRMADRVISERPSDRVLNFTLDGEKYWIKRKLGNGRNQLVKYSVEKEFYYEIARMTIAGRNNPDLVPEIEVLTPDYMVTKDGGPTVKNWLDSDKSEAEKELILEEAGAALAALHKNGIVHGRPALRDITWNDGVIHFLDWENRMYSQDPATQKALDFILLLQGIYRENYPEARERADALERGYVKNGGEETREEARRFLMKHSIVGSLTRQLAPFKMKDIESVRKIYDHLLTRQASCYCPQGSRLIYLKIETDNNNRPFRHFSGRTGE